MDRKKEGVLLLPSENKSSHKVLEPVEGIFIKVYKNGDIYTIDRVTDTPKQRYYVKGIRKAQNDNGHGYLTIHLCSQQTRKRFYVHRLVAEAFLGDFCSELVVNHKNFNRSDNKVENLEMLTTKENIRHSVCAERNHKVLDFKGFEKVVSLWQQGLCLLDIAEEMGIGRYTISRILNKKSYTLYRDRWEEIQGTTWEYKTKRGKRIKSKVRGS